MSRFDTPFNIRVIPNYGIDEKIDYDEALDVLETNKELGGREIDLPERPENNLLANTGGRFDWQLYNGEGDTLTNVHLMRLWCTQMFGQIAKGKAYTNEADASVSVDLTEEELSSLEVILDKVFKSIHGAFGKDLESMVMKKKPKKMKF